jgi:drug/metabolite transporter (DMT)-like permease
MKPSAVTPAALWWVALGAALWGTSGLFRSELLGSLTSLQIVWLEHLLMLPFIRGAFGKLKSLRPAQWALLLAISWGASALATWLFSEAFRYGNPSMVILMQKLQPFAALLAATLLLGERRPAYFYPLLAAAMTGGYLLSFGWNAPFANGPLNWIAPLCALGAALMWGFGTAFGRSLLGTFTFVEMTGLRFVFALPMLTVLMTLNRPADAALIPTLPIGLWLDLALLALLPGLLGILFYYYGLQRSRASYATLAELAFPASALLINWYFLDAALTPIQLLGVLLIWLSVLALTTEQRWSMKLPAVWQLGLRRSRYKAGGKELPHSLS